MKSVVIRADGSKTLGMGHIMRCIAFAESLRELGANPVFVMKNPDPSVADVPVAHGYTVKVIPERNSIDSDLVSTHKIATSMGAEMLVADICHTETHNNMLALERYHCSLAQDFFLVGMAGDRVFNLQASVLVAPYLATGFENLEEQPNRIILAGAEYVILRREFLDAASKPRDIRESASRILITIGGSDEYHSTAKILRGISVLGRLNLELRVVMAAGFTPDLREEVADILGSMNCHYETLGQNLTMAEAMVWADIAITGDGVTKYESAVTGTPNIVVSRPESNNNLNLGFQNAGTTMFLGDINKLSTKFLAARIGGLLDDPMKRQNMSRMGKSLIDGRGVDRIVAHIPKRVLVE